MMQLSTQRTTISAVSLADAGPISAYYLRNASHLSAWEPTRPDGYHTIEAWRGRVAEQQSTALADTSYHFCIRYLDRSEIAGLCSFTNVVRGAFQACHLGYSIDRQHQGAGLMYEGLSVLMPHAFSEFRLHRIMANYMPQNERSGRLLDRLGFEKEGLAKDYLRIAGVWQDHILTSMISDDPIGSNPAD